MREMLTGLVASGLLWCWSAAANAEGAEQILAQGGIPLPGSRTPGLSGGQAPIPGANREAPPPGINRQPASLATSLYSQLPLSPVDAQTRIDELKALLAEKRPQEIQESVMQICEWLADMAEAHNKLCVSFAKSDTTKHEADAERAAAHKFSQLKNQALLLKADLLIKQRRYPEALGPLVDIVVQEPRTPTGQAAYKRLKDLGFAQEPEPKPETKPEGQLPESAATPQGQSASTTTAAGKSPAAGSEPGKVSLAARQGTPPEADKNKHGPAKASAPAKTSTAARTSNHAGKVMPMRIKGTPWGAGSNPHRQQG